MQDLEDQRKRLLEVRKDFEVRYRFLSPEEGGRKTGPPYQFYRSNWAYDGDDPKQQYSIWPIFTDDEGSLVDPDVQVPAQGCAQMFIAVDELRFEIHADRLAPGIRGYFMEGPYRVAEATVTKVLAIAEIDVD